MAEGLTAKRDDAGTLVAMLRDQGYPDLADEVVRRAVKQTDLKPGDAFLAAVTYRGRGKPLPMDLGDEDG